MKVLYIGDNRNRPNWGCRATSMALGAMVRETAEITDIVGGKEIGFSTTAIPWGGLWPNRFWQTLETLPVPPLNRLLRSAKKSWNIREDFVEESPERTIERFHRLRPKHGFLREMLRKVEAADALVVNGEGTYIFSTPPRRDSLFFNFILRLGQQLGKKTYVLNAMFSDCPKTGRNEAVFRTTVGVLARCDAVSTRDSHSLAVLREAGLKDNTSFHPDALFTWSAHVPRWKESITGELSRFQPFGDESHAKLPEIDFDRPYLCLSGSSSAAWQQDKAYAAYAALAKSLLGLGHQLLVTPTCEGDAFLVKVAKDLRLPWLSVRAPIRLCAGIVGKAEVFVSGRFHPAILASDGGTPCVFMGSNSHKTLTLQHMLEYEDPFEFRDIPTEDDVRRITERTRRLIEESPRARIAEAVARRTSEARKVIHLLNQPVSAHS